MAEARDIIVIGASAGGIDALTRLVARLPDELEAAVFVVVHIPAEESMLPAILGRETALIVKAAEDGEPILCNRIYVAPPDCHLLIEPGRIRLSGGPKESGHRPAIDPLFRSAARAYRERVLGVILSGTLDDGSVGLRMIRRHGGSAIVQDPREALFRQMPENAIATANPQHVGPVTDLADLITTHTRRPAEGGEHRELMVEDVNPNGGPQPIGAADVPGTPTGIACPECHGVMWTAADDESPEYHCRVGHAYSAEALLAAHAESVEAALWAGMRALQEQASLTKHMAIRAERRGDRLSAQRLHRRGDAADEHAGRIEAMLLKRSSEAS